jgi:transposase
MFLIVAACAGRGCAVARKRYLIHVAGFNLDILMRALFGQGSPREVASARSALLFFVQSGSTLAIAVISVIDDETPTLVIIVAPDAG